MAKKGGLGLGRGLDALITTKDASQINNISQKKTNAKGSVAINDNIPKCIEVDDKGTLWVNVNFLKPNPKQPRKEFDQSAIEELATSIKEHGIIEPIIIEEDSENSFFIIAGERRTRAAKLAGLEKVPVQLRKYDEQKKLEIALIENIQRTDLNPIEEAKAYYNIMQMGDLSQDETAKRVGKKRSTIANALRLLKLPEEIQNTLVTGAISSGHARALLSVINIADQKVLFNKIISENISVRQAEELANSFNSGGRAATTKNTKKQSSKKDADIISIEQMFIEKFGTKCKLNGTLDRGKIEIEYFSKSDLDRLYNIISGE